MPVRLSRAMLVGLAGVRGLSRRGIGQPTVVIYREFGMRLEDVAYITPQGPKFFTNQSPSIDKPFG